MHERLNMEAAAVLLASTSGTDADRALAKKIVERVTLTEPPADPLARTVSGKCWTWIARLNSKGYAVVRAVDGWKLAHRVTARLSGMEIADLHVDHLCRNRACVNPEHLEPVTAHENIRRSGLAKSINAGRCNVCGSTDGRIAPKGKYRAWKCRPCMREQARTHNANRRARGPAYQAELNARNRAAKVHGTSVRWREFIADHERYLFA